MSRILYVAFPMAVVDAAVAGGAEQVLWTLEQEMAARGHQTSVAACSGSDVAGELLETGLVPEIMDCFEERRAQHEDAILEAVVRAKASGSQFDLIHDQSGHFWRHAGEVGVPVLATLHLPRSLGPAMAFDSTPPNLSFNCVSRSQLSSFKDVPRMLGSVANGIRFADFPPPALHREDYLLWIGRICVEKGPHVAIEAAARAGLPLVIAGKIHAYSYHQDYYRREIAPHIDGHRVRFVDSPSFWEKLKLLRHARALLVPSLVDETSSLVSMEAGACGTPVIGYRRGAIPGIVQDGVTGFVVDTTEQIAEAVGNASEIDPATCRKHIERNFTSGRMADDYERLYRQVLGTSRQVRERAA